VALILISGAGQQIRVSTNAQTVSASYPLKMTLVTPPGTLNELNMPTTSGGWWVSELELGSAAPVVEPNGSNYSPEGVTDWISHNSNYSTWMFNVKPELKWSNGQNVTSQDILATFGPNFDLLPNYDIWGLHSEIQSEYALNSTTAVFVLNASDAHFDDKLRGDVFTNVYPATFANAQGATGSFLGTDAGIGPFYASNYSGGSTEMVMLRNPYFSPAPAITEMDINFVESLSITANFLTSGTVDLAQVEPSDVAGILKDSNLHILDQKGFGISSIEYNVSSYPYNMTEFRQALLYGINESQYIQQAFDGYALSAYGSEGIVSPISSGWYDQNIKQYSYDPNQAMSLLSSIGITKGSDGLLHYPNGTAVSLTLWSDTDNPQDVVGATVVKNNLDALGFHINLETTSAANIIGDFSANVNGITSSMILDSNDAPVWGIPFLDSEPAWNVYWLPVVPEPYWEYPPSANDEYQSNFSSLVQTDNTTMVKGFLDNIQVLNAKYLPTLVLAYPDSLWGYSTQRWTNWPSGDIEFGAASLNWTALATIQPYSSNHSNFWSQTTIVALTVAIVVVLALIGLTVFLKKRRR
jgi:ABC-type transport system substrate-binding protein